MRIELLVQLAAIFGALTGTVGTVLAIGSLVRTRRAEEATNEVRLAQLFNEAYDLMGGAEGATSISVRKALSAEARDSHFCGRRKSTDKHGWRRRCGLVVPRLVEGDC